MSTVIKVENLGKSYIIDHEEGERYTALRDVITNKFIAGGKRIKSIFSSNHRQTTVNNGREEFWALKDINFEVKQGEVLGIIGRNGAGKSTLLKLLSRITEPTEGSIHIKGRVASLLEVGTGFHPELTGRENIFLNGAILGMPRSEVRRKFDEIVAFAEVEKFLDTPVKRYSSGMYVRLAFAVAAHLEPEILVVDEVLAVGDAEFQKKCLGKMEDVSRGEGRTVLFVSHNLDSVLRLCSFCLWLGEGKVRGIGSPSRMVDQYQQHRQNNSTSVELSDVHRRSSLRRHATFRQISCPTNDGQVAWNYLFGNVISFSCKVDISKTLSQLAIAYAIFSSTGFEIASARSRPFDAGGVVQPGTYNISVEIPNLRLSPNLYSLNIGLRSEFGDEDFISGATTFEVVTDENAAWESVDSIRAACVPVGRFRIQGED